MSRVRTPDRQRPFIDLLDRPAVTAWDDPIAFQRLRAQAERVRQWYLERTGWTLVQRRDVFRLVKTPALTNPGHGFRWAEDPLDYELAVWVLWYGEENDADAFVLTRLTEEIEQRANELVGPGHVNWNLYAHRLALRRALAGLEAIGLLRRLDGDTQQWAEDRSSNSMYEFTPLRHHFHAELPTAVVGEIGQPLAAAEIAAALEPGAAAPLARAVPPEQRLYRTLLLSPALFSADDPEAFGLLGASDRRRRIAEDLGEAFGWDLEVTSAYACLLRPSASEASEGMLFPIQGALSHVILLLFAELRERVRQGTMQPDAFDRLRLSEAQLTSIVADLRSRYGERWGATMGHLSTRALVEQVLGALAEWDLLRGPDANGQLYVMPLAARFTGTYAEPTAEAAAGVAAAGTGEVAGTEEVAGVDIAGIQAAAGGGAGNKAGIAATTEAAVASEEKGEEQAVTRGEAAALNTWHEASLDEATASLHAVCRTLPGGPQGWRPSRLILQNYWLFGYQEFHFTHGRLVLRGANTTGKSTVLVSAITLALDGEKRRERLDTFGGQGRGIAYYLVGLGDATPENDFYYEERTGYVALEFEHASDGRFLTIGVGLYTSRNRPDLAVDSWGFALTDGRRIGIDFDLFDEDRIPLTRRQLAQRIGAGGSVVERASDYQALVNRLLFGYEDVREYDFLLNLLLQLRSPKLNKDTKPSMICEMLQESLPPLPASLLGQVTQIIDDIDFCLEDVEHTRACLEAAAAVDDGYAHFLNQRAQLAAVAVRQAEEATASARRAVEAAEAELGRAVAERNDVRTGLAAVREELVRTSARRETLEQHEAYRDQQQLATWREERERARQSCQEAEAAVKASEEAVRRAEEAAEALAQEWSQLVDGLRRAAEAMDQTAMEAVWALGRREARAAAELVGELKPGVGDAPGWSAAALARAAELRLDQLQELDRAYQAFKEAERQHEAARRDVERQRTSLDEADGRLRSARQALENARQAAVAAVRAWLDAASAFVTDPGLADQVAAALEAYGQTERGGADGSWRHCLAPIMRAFEAQEADAQAEIRRRGTDLELARRERDRLREELRDWLERRDPAPARRAEQVAARRILADAAVPAEPLYAVCDVRADVDPALAAQVETVLDEAGLLDALVVPVEAAAEVERRLAAAGLGDRWLRPAAAAALAERLRAADADQGASGTLLDVLRPAEGHPAAHHAAAVLANIGWGASPNDGAALAGGASPAETAALAGGASPAETVALAGDFPAAITPTSWCVGNLRGQASRPAEPTARFIGEANRRRHREAIIARLRAQLDEQEQAVWQLESGLDTARAHLHNLRREVRELEELPAWDELQATELRVSEAASWLEERRRALDEANRAAEEQYRRLLHAQAGYESRLGDLPEARGRDRDGLRDLMEATRRTVADGRRLEAELGRIGPWRARSHRNAEDRRAALARLERDRARLAGAQAQLVRWEERCRALEERLAEAGVRIEDLLAELRALREAEERLHQSELELVRQEGVLSNREQHARDRFEAARKEAARAREQRDGAVAALRSSLTAYPTLAPVLEMLERDPETGPQAAAGELLKYRRSDEKDLESAVRESLERARQQLATAFADRRSQLADYAPSLDEDGAVTFRHMGEMVAPHRLRSILAEDLAIKSRILQEKERELYEDIILREVARQIRTRIASARQWQGQINRLLAQRQLSNGEILSLSWNPLPPSQGAAVDFGRVVELLQRDVETLTESEVHELVEHFRRRVGQVREEYRDDRLGGRSFAEALADVLDYRRWFRFQLHSKVPNEPRRELTDLRFAARSGAEKSLAMFVPILAAVHARYQLAAPDAPRLIGMDEAFAGVDEQNIREMYRFLVELDFCWIMTSEKLWGVADTLPGCSTYELVRRGNVVTAVLAIWDGRRVQSALTLVAAASRIDR